MDPVQITWAACDIGCGILFILVCLPMVYRKIPMNRLYGVRTPKAFRSDEDWYAINEYGGKVFIAWSVPLLITGTAKLLVSETLLECGVPILVVASGPVLVCTLGATVQTLIYSWKR